MTQTTTLETARPTRLAYPDNFRSLVILLVVVMHSNVTYSGFGSWYYTEGNPQQHDALSRFIFGFYGSFTQAWFMGALFFLSALFAAGSLQRKGTGRFVGERAMRLGVPTLLFMLVIAPLMYYFQMNYGDMQSRMSFGTFYLGFLTSFEWLSATGPLWFAEALLIGSLLYAVWRRNFPSMPIYAEKPAPGPMTLVLVILSTALVAFSIRLFMPIGASWMNLQFPFFATYVTLFILGLKAGEEQWFESLLDRQGMGWFWVALGAGVPLWILMMATSGVMQGHWYINGGLHWQSFAYALWESFVAISFTIGLLAVMRRFVNVSNAATRYLSDNAFGVFVLHAPVLTGISLLLVDWHAPMLMKHVVVAPLAFAASLAASSIVRLVPVFRTILK